MRLSGRMLHAAWRCRAGALFVLLSLALLPSNSTAALSWAFGRSFLPETPTPDERPDTDSSGRRVNLGSHSLYLHCRGRDGPTVVVDTALGSLALEWQHVQKILARRMSVCLYDRGGYGQSDPGPLPRTSARLAEELRELLQQAAVRGPYVLVGHSFGGYSMLRFAGRYPEAVAGIVLVDSSHPEQYERFLAPPFGIRTAPSSEQRGIRQFRFGTPSLHPNLPPEIRADVMSYLIRLPTRTAIAEEFFEFRRSALDVREAGPLPDVPLLVISRGPRAYPQDFRGKMIEALWLELQTELARLAPHSAHIVAEHSGHYVHLDQPQLVVDGISLVVDLARLQRPEVGLTQAAAWKGRPAWYAFEGATWRSDGFQTLEVMGPEFTSQNGYRSPGRSADPAMLAWLEGRATR
ncbi:MAG: alpha/beta hydrolase [Gammaproteobacteria bacterium]|nr:alpha/beta hydrolase [Gammaproteobacteria bacterium]